MWPTFEVLNHLLPIQSQTRDRSSLAACFIVAWILVWPPPAGDSPLVGAGLLPPLRLPFSQPPLQPGLLKEPEAGQSPHCPHGGTQGQVKTGFHSHNPNITIHLGKLRCRAA